MDRQELLLPFAKSGRGLVTSQDNRGDWSVRDWNLSVCENAQILVRIWIPKSTASGLWGPASDTARTALSRAVQIVFIFSDPVLRLDVVMGLLEPHNLKFITSGKERKVKKNEVAGFSYVFITVTIDTDNVEICQSFKMCSSVVWRRLFFSCS